MGEGRPERLVETVLYRVVQEALSNVARHARARRACVRLGRKRALLTCSIRDDGVGFDVASAERKGGGGLGLLAIRERLDALRGRLQIRSSPGQGTELRVTIPTRTCVPQGTPPRRRGA